jgi:hypothetical protein
MAAVFWFKTTYNDIWRVILKLERFAHVQQVDFIVVNNPLCLLEEHPVNSGTVS